MASSSSNTRAADDASMARQFQEDEDLAAAIAASLAMAEGRHEDTPSPSHGPPDTQRPGETTAERLDRELALSLAQEGPEGTTAGLGGDRSPSETDLDRQIALSLAAELETRPALPGDHAVSVALAADRVHALTTGSSGDLHASLQSVLGAGSDSDDALARLVSGQIHTPGTSLLGQAGRSTGPRVVPNHARTHPPPPTPSRDSDLPSYEELVAMPVVRTGLTPAQRRKIPSRHFRDTDRETKKCTICLTDFKLTSLLCELPACKHYFHRPCVEEWFAVSKKCPLCNVEVET